MSGPASRDSLLRSWTTTSPLCSVFSEARSNPTGASTTTPLPNFAASAERWNASTAPSKRASANPSAALSEGGSTQDDLITIRGDRFVIPVKAEFKRKVPGVIHGSSSSGQTVFVEPLETIEQNNELVRLLDEEQSEIHRILVVMTRALGENATAIYLGTSILAEVESHFARARFADALNCVRPSFTQELSLTAARHPLLELRMRAEALAQE